MGQKSGQRVQNSLNKNQVSSDLLGESTNSVIRAAGGIHQFCHPTCWGNPLIGNFSIRPTGGIHQFFHQSCWGNPSILSSDLLGESIKTNSCAMSKEIAQKWPNNSFLRMVHFTEKMVGGGLFKFGCNLSLLRMIQLNKKICKKHCRP